MKFPKMLRLRNPGLTAATVLLAATAMLAPLRTGAAPTAAKAGQRMPALRTLGLEGSVPAIEGKVILVDFWASWCGPCKKSFPELEALHKAFRDRGLVVLGVNVDRKASDMEAFLKSQQVTFPVVRDAGHTFVGAMGVASMPTSLLVDRKGVIRSIHSGFRGEETVKELRAEIQKLLEEKP